MKTSFLLLGAVFIVVVYSETNFWKELFKDFQLDSQKPSENIRSHCGRNDYNNLVRNKRVIGGRESRLAEWPWLVSLLLWTNNQSPGVPEKVEHLCGGTLISASWILTAAHCFEKKWSQMLSSDPAKWTARLGEHNLFQVESHQTDHEIKSIFLHKSRHTNRMDNDIALIKLKKAVKFNKYIKPACLPYPEERFVERTPCTTIGWGHTAYNGTLATIPRHVSLEVVSFPRCKETYDMLQSFTNNEIYKIAPTMLCAGHESGKDACQYDSGGPLLCKSRVDDNWITAGIVSFGFGCGLGVPGIYTRVTSYLDWIHNITTGN